MNKSQGKAIIKNGLPEILLMNEYLSAEEVREYLNINKNRYILGQLFILLETELHHINNQSDFDYLNKLVYYIEVFSKVKSFSKIYTYRKAKMTNHVIEDLIKVNKKNNPTLCIALNDIYKTLNIIKSNALIVECDQYKFMMQFICEIKDIKDIKILIDKYPDFVNLKDKNGIPIIYNLIEGFIRRLINKKLSTNIYAFTYEQAVINTFLESNLLAISEKYKRMIEDILNEAVTKLENSNEGQKLLWIKSLCHIILGKEPLSPDEILNKYNIYIHQLADEARNYKQNKDGRLIIKNKKIVTIDGQYSYDKDDAITLEKIDNKYHLSGFIADLASIIKRGSHLDAVARKQGTTYYFPNQTKPLFPFSLSHDLCSLNPGSLKNVLWFHLIINQNGEIEEGIDISPACIEVSRSLSFDETKHILINGDPDLELTGMLNHMSDLASLLRSKNNRINISNIDNLDLGLDLSGKTMGHQIIEEFMILINAQTAQMFGELTDTPFIFRNHKFDREEELKRIKEFMTNLYESNSFEAINDIINILSNIANSAKYSIFNTGHEALNLDYYSHVTAPIRRYVDLEIQRILYDFLFTKPTLIKVKFYEQHLDRLVANLNNSRLINKSLEEEYIRSLSLTRKHL